MSADYLATLRSIVFEAREGADVRPKKLILPDEIAALEWAVAEIGRLGRELEVAQMAERMLPDDEVGRLLQRIKVPLRIILADSYHVGHEDGRNGRTPNAAGWCDEHGVAMAFNEIRAALVPAETRPSDA